MEKITVERRGHRFEFEDFHLDVQYGKLEAKMSVDGKHETNCAEYIPSRKAFRFPGIKFAGMPQEVGGLNIDAETEAVAAIEAFLAAETEKRNADFDFLVSGLLDGSVKIRWTVVGCEFETWHAWIDIDALPEQYRRLANRACPDILSKAIDALAAEYGLKVGSVNSWQAIPEPPFRGEKEAPFANTLREILSPGFEETREKKAQEAAHEAEIFAEAKRTGERQVLRRWVEDCIDPDEECSCDECVEWANPDGSRKTETHHTY